MRTIKLVFLALLFTAVFAGVFPLSAVILNANGANLTGVLYGSLTLHIVIVTTLVTVIASLAFYRLLSWLVPRPRAAGADMPGQPPRLDPALAIMVFALVAIFNVGTVYSVLSGLANAWQELFNSASKMMDPVYINYIISNQEKSIQGMGTTNDYVILSSVYMDASGRLFDICGRFLLGLFKSVLSGNAVSFYCWWLLLFLLGTLDVPGSGQRSNVFLRMSTWIRTRAEPERQRMVLGLVFLIGLYFSIAAIIAIPALQHNNLATPINRDYVEKALNSVSTSKESFQSRFPELYKKDLSHLTDATKAMAELPAEIKKRADALPENERASFTEFYTARLKILEDAYKYAGSLRDQMRVEWTKQRAIGLSRQEKLAKGALNAFEVGTLNPVSGPERVAYLQQVVYWFQLQQGYDEDSLQGSMRIMDDFDIELTRFLPGVSGALFAVTPPPRFDPSTSEGRAPPIMQADPLSRLTDRSYLAPPLNNIEQMNASAPTPPEPGSFAGAFGFIARWLLSTRSFELALITGMIGFGLLGAAVSNYVRTDIANGPLASAERVVIQGVSAAIVIFLTVHGGLGMLASGEKEPNGYVMCFACFVGAVFSEHVWVWAKQRLIDMLPNKSSRPPNPPPPHAPLAPPPNPLTP